MAGDTAVSMPVIRLVVGSIIGLCSVGATAFLVWLSATVLDLKVNSAVQNERTATILIKVTELTEDVKKYDINGRMVAVERRLGLLEEAINGGKP